MSRPFRTLLAAALSTTVLACAEAATSAGGPEQAAYLTLLGEDTLAAEWMEFGDGSVQAQAIVRGSRTLWGEYRLEHGPSGELTAWEARTYAGGSSDGELVSSETLVHEGDSAVLVTTRGGQEARRALELGPCAVPFVDMLHWPFEAAMRCQVETQGATGDSVETFTARGGSTFPVRANDDGSTALVHPSRGPSTMHVDGHGRILDLDGTGSTRAYDLRRMTSEELDREAFGAMFADRPLGDLSGRGEIDDVVAGVHFAGDYGTPRKRGRDIFGHLVAYGVRWRTGANAATGLSFDRDIVIDGTTVPAGEYTLYTIPEEDGGTLIINRRTGQTGTSYDEAEDQARVRMRRDALDETVEVFEIRVVPDGENAGRIELRWDDTVYWVPFTVA